MPALMVLNEDAVPKTYWDPGEPRLRRQILASDLKGGAEVAGAIVPASPGLVPEQIDKSLLTIAEPKRLRDKAHLRFVASQPCLVCGRQPAPIPLNPSLVPEFFGCRLRAHGSYPEVRYRYKIDIRGQPAHSLQPLYRLFYWGFSQLNGRQRRGSQSKFGGGVRRISKFFANESLR